MNGENKTQAEYDEIDLMDYVKVIIKRIRLILAVFLAMTIAVIVASLVMPKIYKIETSLEIGSIGGAIVEVPSQIVEKINNDVYGILVRQELGISEDKYPKIKTENPKDTNLVTISIESDKTQEAKNILGDINNLILKEHEEKIQKKKELIQQDIERSKNKITSLEEEKKNLEAKVASLQRVLVYQQDPGSQFAFFDTKENLEKKKQEIESLYMGINLLQGALDDVRFTSVIKEPIASEKPVKPNLILNTVIAAVLGLFLGVFLAFIKEWWEKNRGKLAINS
jgi:capsular polysaccharide biosynthesis protein